MSAAEGSFEGERAYHDRDITIKYHCLKNAGMVRRVTVNGEEVAFVRTQKDKSVFPLGVSAAAPDADTVTVSFRTDVQKNYTVKFYL